jgi:primosomal protein N' (replication factor Y)
MRSNLSMPQQTLFDLGPDPWEADDQADQLAATVVFTTGPTEEFDYSVPEELRDRVQPGRRLRVPLGRGDRLLVGYCVRVGPCEPGHRRLKPVAEVIDAQTLLSPAMLRLTRWIADYYLCHWGQVLEAVVPTGVRTQAGTRAAPLLSLGPGAAERVDDPKLPPKQAAVLRVLAQASGPMTLGEVARRAGCTQAPISALRRAGLIETKTGRVAQNEPVAAAAVKRQARLTLNADQERALATILPSVEAGRHHVVLIHGVTGSGKTEVYIQAIERAVALGRQAIVLVPEISLTPQTVERFRSRFDHVAVLHSHLTDTERHWHWNEIAQGRVDVVVGVRSAIFAPTPRLGLIVVDEEHENTFKQDITPRYHARDVAIARAEMEQVPLVLGSATPSLESWQRAQEGRMELVEMPRRVLDRPMPVVGTIDLRDEIHSRYSRGAISRPLHNAIRVALTQGGQVILLLNRRGFATHIQCPACGGAMRCPECDIALTHHRQRDIALCHYCDYQVPAPTECPQCHFAGIRYSGLGTQRLEAEVLARFPGVPCLRMDTDSMQTRGSHEQALNAFRTGKVRILLGTQMIAKGLDFPNVTLVGVINADTALHLPDFRAAERTFQLVTQVAGRTGRGEKGGRVLVQTFSPEHPAIQAAVHHDYAAFAREELPMRKMMRYPPFTTLVRLVVRGPQELTAAAFAKTLAERLVATLEAAGVDARVLGPAPAPFARLRGLYRFQIQVQGPEGEQIRRAVRETTQAADPPEEVQWIADVDAVEML